MQQKIVVKNTLLLIYCTVVHSLWNMGIFIFVKRNRIRHSDNGVLGLAHLENYTEVIENSQNLKIINGCKHGYNAFFDKYTEDK